jgi:putative ABC transport system permease protein
MLRNYATVARRAISRRPGFAALNVLGLALGLAGCFLIVLFIQHERGFDRFHEHGDRIFRLTYASGDGGERSATTAAGFASVLEDRFPEVERVIRIEQQRTPYLRLPGGEVRQPGMLTLADDGFFEVFNFPLLRGTPETALADPYSIVLREGVARALFGDEDPIGQRLALNDRFDLTVTAVAADPPLNSTIRFDAVAPFRLITEFMGDGALDDFTNFNFMTYVLLRPGSDPGALAAGTDGVVREQFGEDTPYTSIYQPLPAIHFDTGVRFDYTTTRDPRYLWVFGAIALLILVLACVNFTNLATAQALQRAREVGVRKSLGARRGQLASQFLGESVLLAVAATLLALVLALLAAPLFNDAINSTSRLDVRQPGLLALLVGIGLAAGLLAGGYPALYLSAFRPAVVLRGAPAGGGRAPVLRRALVVFQFAATAFMLVATLTVYRQLGYVQSQALGFEQELVVSVNAPPPLWASYDAFRDAALASPHVASVSRGTVPGRVNTNRGYNWPGQNGDEMGQAFWTLLADENHLGTLGIELLAGRDFIASEADHHDAYIINEAAARQLGYAPAEAVGQPFRAWDRPMGTIVGVTSDFHFQSLHAAVEPVVINFKPDWLGGVVVRLAPGHLPSAIDALRASWEPFAPGYALEYTFLDADIGRLYFTEQRLARLFGLFAGLAVLIACLGLFGLAAYSAEQRRREIGVRKVLGASTPRLVALLSTDFLKLVGIALVVAAPLAYLAMSRWLEGFAYRVSLGAGVFAAAAAIAVGIALLTVSYHAIRAATADPVHAIRSE